MGVLNFSKQFPKVNIKQKINVDFLESISYELCKL